MKASTKKKISKTVKKQYLAGRDRLLGEKRYNWKGDDVGYFSLHTWVKKQLGTPNICGKCKKERRDAWFNWANISGQYKRDISDWVYVCVPCHRKMDGRTKVVYQYSVDGLCIATHESLRELERNHKYSHGSISACCRGKQKTAYGYKWSYEALAFQTLGEDGNI